MTLEQAPHRRIKPAPAKCYEAKRATQRVSSAQDFVRRGWMTTRQAATHLGFDHCEDPVRAFWKFAKRAGLASYRRGRVLLFDPADLDAAIGASRRRVG